MNGAAGFMSPARTRGGVYDWLAEAALVSVTVVAAAGLSRLFTDTSFLPDVLALAFIAHVVTAAARRAGLSTLAGALLSGGSLVVTATVLFYADTAWFVLPTAGTVSAARQHVVDGWRVLNSSNAPVAPVEGLVLLSGAALSLSAFLADSAAFRRRAAVTAVMPASAVYLFAAAAGTGDGAVWYGALFGAAVAAMLALLWLRSRRADPWIEPRPGRGTLVLARSGAAALMLAVSAGVVAGPRLPGARADPWIDAARLEFTEAAPWVDAPSPVPEPWADFGLRPDPAASKAGEPVAGAGAGPRVLVSPLVQVRSRLIELSDRELFTVAVLEDERQYWRLTSLDEFDGNGWRARSHYDDATGPLPATLDPSTAGPPLAHTVSLAGLGNSYLPAAFEPRRVIDDGGVALEYEAASGSLIKARSTALEGPARFSYSVESAVPVIDDPDRLRGVDTSVLDPDFLAFNTLLPDDARSLVGAEAERITSDARTDYHRALLLQDHFRLDGGFRYDLDVDATSNIDSLADFLFDVRAGYCEQFASAYAAMARSIGLPTRVAVGFTWGEWDAGRGEQGAYVVRGEHAHAWPEVYFAGTGWVRFEPTPGRGAPGDFAVTGHVANQAGLVAEPAVVPLGADLGTLGSGADDGVDEAGSGVLLRRAADPGADPSDGSGNAPGSGSPGVVSRRNLAVVAVVLAALGLAAGSVPVLRRAHRSRRRARLADDPAGLIEGSWDDALEALELVRLVPLPFETPLELARRIVAAFPAAGPMEELAVLATHGRYARETPESMAARAAVAGQRVIGACRQRVGMLRRLAAALDPSTAFRGRSAR